MSSLRYEVNNVVRYVVLVCCNDKISSDIHTPLVTVKLTCTLRCKAWCINKTCALAEWTKFTICVCLLLTLQRLHICHLGNAQAYWVHLTTPWLSSCHRNPPHLEVMLTHKQALRYFLVFVHEICLYQRARGPGDSMEGSEASNCQPDKIKSSKCKYHIKCFENI